jgi:hypothetical protein
VEQQLAEQLLKRRGILLDFGCNKHDIRFAAGQKVSGAAGEAAGQHKQQQNVDVRQRAASCHRRVVGCGQGLPRQELQKRARVLPTLQQYRPG